MAGQTTTTTRPEPPTTPTAEPCLRCGTTGGYIPPHCRRPTRERGYCKSCYNILNYHGELELGQVDCLSCGAPDRGHIRGLCGRCYGRALSQGIAHRYPACGPVPVPYIDHRWGEHPDPIPAGLAPILRPNPAQPVWTGLALVKYPAPTWHTYGPRTDARQAA